MCLIISVDRDHATDEVIDWLDFLQSKFKRINVTQDIEKEEICLSLDHEIDIKSDNGKGWLRKDGRFRELEAYKEMLVDESFDLTHYLYLELGTLRKLYFRDKKTKWLGNPQTFHVSKMDVLDNALRAGVTIPKSFVINTKRKLIEVFEKCNGKIITKSLTDVPRFKRNEKYYSPLTTKVEKEDIDALPDTFFPTLIQEQIEKEFEVRSFYIEGEFFSAAIFSQSDDQTKVDFRKYNYKSPNRLVPYSLPKEVETKLDTLFKMCNINTGSVDLIKGLDKTFYFLEINQGGQFSMISRPCNFRLDRDIAQRLL